MSIRYQREWIQDSVRKAICPRLRKIAILQCYKCNDRIEENKMIYYSSGVVCYSCNEPLTSIRLDSVDYVREWCETSRPSNKKEGHIGEVISKRKWIRIMDALRQPIGLLD